MLDVSIIIVSFNTKEFIKNCLISILSSIDGKPRTTMMRGKLSYEIIVVDNASTDGSALVISRLRQDFGGQANFKAILNNKNVGFSKANNQGIKASQKSRYILFLNPDTVAYKNTIDGMIEFMDKTPNAGAATCFIELVNGKLDDSCHRGFPTPWRAFCYFVGLSKLFPKSQFFAGYNMTYLDLNKTHEIESLAGSFMIIRRDVGEKLGWWDEDFFFYGEDLDFCFRIKTLGYKIYFVPKFKSLHYKGVSSGIKNVSKSITKATKETRAFATEHRFNAMRIFYKKHYQDKYPKFITWFIYYAISFKERLSCF